MAPRWRTSRAWAFRFQMCSSSVPWRTGGWRQGGRTGGLGSSPGVSASRSIIEASPNDVKPSTTYPGYVSGPRVVHSPSRSKAVTRPDAPELPSGDPTRPGARIPSTRSPAPPRDVPRSCDADCLPSPRSSVSRTPSRPRPVRGSRPTSTETSHPCSPGAAWNATPGPTRKASSTCRGVRRPSRGARMARRSSRGRPTRARSGSRSRATRCRPSTRCRPAEKLLLKAWVAGGARWGTDPIDPLRTSTDRRAGRDWWSLQPVEPPGAPADETPGRRTRSTRSCSDRLEAAGLGYRPQADRRTLDPPSHLRPDRLAPDPRGGRRRSWPTFGPTLTSTWSTGFSHRPATASAGHGSGSTSPATARATASNSTSSARIPGAIATGSSTPSTATSPTTNSPACRSPATSSGPTTPRPSRRPASSWPARTTRRVRTSRARPCGKVVRQDEMEDIVGTVGQTFLGLTVHCGRCHDHKFDPMTQADYYRLSSALSGVRHGERDLSRARRTSRRARRAGRMPSRRASPRPRASSRAATPRRPARWSRPAAWRASQGSRPTSDSPPTPPRPSAGSGWRPGSPTRRTRCSPG